MKTHLEVAGAMVILAAGVAQAATSSALFDGFESTDLSAWRHSDNANGLSFVVSDTTTRNPGFDTGKYMTNFRASYDDDMTRPMQSTATLVAGGKITYSMDYVAKDSQAYALRFGIYGGSANVKDAFATWGGALTDTGTVADWAGYLGSLTLNGTGTSNGSVAVAKNSSTSNFLWSTSSEVKGSTVPPVRNDGTARTAAMIISMDESNAITVSLFDVAKGGALDTPIATTTYTTAATKFTNFNYVGFVLRSTGAAGTDTDYIAVDNLNVSVETPNPVPETATMGLLLAGGAALLGRRRRSLSK